MKIVMWFMYVALFVMVCLIVRELIVGPTETYSVSSVHGEVSGEQKFLGKCWEDTLNSSVDIYIAEYIREGIGGDFSTEKPLTIRIVERSLDTVAHEASHLVNHLLLERNIKDEETEAYLQGFYTECIYRLATRGI